MSGLTPCGVGTAAELRFAAEAAQRGLGVLLPWGHDHPYDLVIDCDGVLSRIQVKSAAYREDFNRYDADVRLSPNTAGSRGKALPDTGNYDVMAVMAGPMIYLIPAIHVRGRTSLSLRPPGCERVRKSGPPTKFDVEDWREAWFLLKSEGDSH